MQIGNIDWRCAFCSMFDTGEPVAESTRLSMSTIYDPPYVTFGTLEQLQEESAVGK